MTGSARLLVTVITGVLRARGATELGPGGVTSAMASFRKSARKDEERACKRDAVTRRLLS